MSLAVVDKKVLEDRLTCRETNITGHAAVLRVATRFNAFVAAIAAAAAAAAGAQQPPGGAADVVPAHDALVKELMLMRLEVSSGGVGDRSPGWGVVAACRRHPYPVL